MRIGDFYNTKIIPESLSLQYEELDINPEGIGVQPMIANVSLNFKFVGGSGLKESVDRLQNALTFNYYANTEIYDDRADVTAQEDFLKVLDDEFLAMAVPPKPPAANQAAPNNGQNNNQTIGSILNRTNQPFGENGTISYSDFMVNFVNQTQTYFQNVVNKQITITSQYNNAVRQQWMAERNYTYGGTSVDTAPVSIYIFGKPNNVENRFNQIFANLEEDITNDDDQFINFISDTTKNLTPRVINAIKTNYSNVIKNKRGVFQNAVTQITQELVTLETQYIQSWSRANIITYDYTTGFAFDGFQSAKGDVTVYEISGLSEVDVSSTSATDTLDELVIDLQKVRDNISEFNDIIWATNSFVYSQDNLTYDGVMVYKTENGIADGAPSTDVVFEPFSKKDEFTNGNFKRQYMIFSDDILDDKKYQTFKQSIIGDVINNTALIGDSTADVSKIFDDFWIVKSKPLYIEENNITKGFLDSVAKNELKDFLIYTPFPKKNRILGFSTENVFPDPSLFDLEKSWIKSLAAQTNSSNDQATWNDDISGALISKAKLN